MSSPLFSTFSLVTRVLNLTQALMIMKYNKAKTRLEMFLIYIILDVFVLLPYITYGHTFYQYVASRLN